MKEKEEKSFILELSKQVFVTVPEFIAEKVLLTIQNVSDVWIRVLLYGGVIVVVVLLLLLLKWLGGFIVS